VQFATARLGGEAGLLMELLGGLAPMEAVVGRVVDGEQDEVGADHEGGREQWDRVTDERVNDVEQAAVAARRG